MTALLIAVLSGGGAGTSGKSVIATDSPMMMKSVEGMVKSDDSKTKLKADASTEPYIVHVPKWWEIHVCAVESSDGRFAVNHETCCESISM